MATSTLQMFVEGPSLHQRFPRRGGGKMSCRIRPASLPWPSMILDLGDMLLIGLTGNIGSGKSTVAQLLSERGATIIDADVLARRAVEQGTSAYSAIVERWGTSILAADGLIDRAALRRIVFSEPLELEELNEI